MYQSLVWLADYLQFTVISFICKEIYEEAGGGGEICSVCFGKGLMFEESKYGGINLLSCDQITAVLSFRIGSSKGLGK